MNLVKSWIDVKNDKKSKLSVKTDGSKDLKKDTTVNSQDIKMKIRHQEY